MIFPRIEADDEEDSGDGGCDENRDSPGRRELSRRPSPHGTHFAASVSLLIVQLNEPSPSVDQSDSHSFGD